MTPELPELSKRQGGAVVGSTALFGVGDSVTWMHVSQNGSSMRFSERQGEIIKVNGGMAYVKLRNGRETHVLVEMLRRAGDKNHVTELFEALTSPNGSDQRGRAADSQ